MTIDLDEHAPLGPHLAELIEADQPLESVQWIDGPAEAAAPTPSPLHEPSDGMVDEELPPPPASAGPDHPGTAPKARKQIRTARRSRTTRRPAQPATATAEPSTTESSLLKELSERVSALELDLADNRRSVSELDQALAAAVETATTDELVEAKQRVQVAAGSMASLAQAISESASDITSEVSAESATALLVSFAAEVESVLLQLGFGPLQTRVGDSFDPTRHRSLRRVVTNDQELDKTIFRVIRDGFGSNASKRILLYSDVEVNRFVPERNSH